MVMPCFIQFVWRLRVAGLSLAVGATLTGYAAGPDFRTPGGPVAASDDSAYSYTLQPLSLRTASVHGAAAGGPGTVQSFAIAQDIPAQRWQVFHSSALEQLLRSALIHSLNLAAAQAALRAAQENFNASAGNLLYPNVDAQLGVARQRASSAAA